MNDIDTQIGLATEHPSDHAGREIDAYQFIGLVAVVCVAAIFVVKGWQFYRRR